MAGSNDRNKSFKGAQKGNFHGRTDYDSGRPKKGVDSIPDMGDKGVPPHIISIDGIKRAGPVDDIAGGESRGIPPMKANPSGIGIKIKGVTIQDPHV